MVEAVLEHYATHEVEVDAGARIAIDQDSFEFPGQGLPYPRAQAAGPVR